MEKFADLNLPAPLARALEAMGYETPTPVQKEAIPLALEGRDLLVTAQTGTGKTAAFAIPLLSRMFESNSRPSPVLILAPTRELAEQTGSVLGDLTQYCEKLKTSVIIGGASYYKQVASLRANPVFIVGTPGRLIDQVARGVLKLDDVGCLVLDEADRLLDMGFEPQIDEIAKHLPQSRQTMLFSATLAAAVERLARKYMRDPVRIAIGAPTVPVERIEQKIIKTTAKEKNAALIEEIDKVAGSIIVFTRTKDRTERVAKVLREAGHEVDRIHGDRSQAQRSKAISSLRDGSIRILVATDIAARGIDVPNIRHVINYDLPLAPEDYIHRIGRTARAGAEGQSLAFVTPEDFFVWAKIHKLIYGRYPEGERPPKVKKDFQHGKFKGPSGGKVAKGPRKPGTRPSTGPASSSEQSPSRAPNRAERRATKTRKKGGKTFPK